MIDAVLFDIGNVLVRFDFQKAVAAMAAHSPLPAPEIRAVLDRWHTPHETGEVDSAEFVRVVLREALCEMTGAEFRRAFCEIFTLNAPMWELVRKLAGRTPVYLFSNTSELHQDWLFAEYPEFSLFDGGFYSWKVGAMKPDLPIYAAALEMTGARPERIAYIDDLLPNIATGQAQGLRSFAYHPDRHEDFLAEARAAGLDW